jgi:hypothetical protein
MGHMFRLFVLAVGTGYSLTMGAAPTLAADPCASLTPVAINQVIQKIEGSLSFAQQDRGANGQNGYFASAARDNVTYLEQARDKMVALQTWLKSTNLESPYVTNPTGAFNVHGYVRETVGPLHHARHWATISVGHHLSKEAKDSFRLTSEALDLIEPLGAQAGRCYMNAFLP